MGEDAREEEVHEEVVEETEDWRARGQLWLKSSGSGGCDDMVNLRPSTMEARRTYQKVIRISARKIHVGDVKVCSAGADVGKAKGAQGGKRGARSVEGGRRDLNRCRGHLYCGEGIAVRGFGARRRRDGWRLSLRW